MRFTSLALAMLLAGSSVAVAQRETTGVKPLPGGRAGRLARPRANPAKQQAVAPNQALAKQVRQAFAGVVRRQLNLSDEQSRKLQEVDSRFQRQRNDVVRDERQARVDLRAALADSASAADQGKVDGYLARLVQAQRKRADLLEAEQKELAGFLNPVQRAKYLALREQLQKRIAQLRQEGAGAAATPPAPPPAY